MAIDLTKLILHTGYDAFKNNNVYTNSFVIGGSYNGVTEKTFNFTLSSAPDIADVQFSAASMQYGPERPSPPANSFIDAGGVLVPASAPISADMLFLVATELTGTTLTFRCFGVTTTSGSGTLTDTTVSWRLVDYSVF